MDFNEAIQNIDDEPKVINVALTDEIEINNEIFTIVIKEEPELEICDGIEDEMEHLETIDLTDVIKPTANQSGCENCPKIINDSGKIQQIHYCYAGVKTKNVNTKLQAIPRYEPRPLHKCNECYKQFTFKSELILHKRVHKEKRSYKCNKCKRTLFSISSYKQHVLHAHTDDKNIIEQKRIKMKGVNSEGKPYNYDIMVYL